jgi:hypothetical protein
MTQQPGSKGPQQGPDPEIQDAIGRLHQTELNPLEEVMFKSWMNANGIDPDKNDLNFDLRSLYRQTGGKVLPPDQLKQAAQTASDIQTLTQAQQAHEQSSPMKMFQNHQQPAGLMEELVRRQG